jgi:glycosyltransferase involved in cell wall biosynthesis
MSCGVIPVVYGSFSAADDIIDDGINGIVIPKGEQGFDAELMASNVKRLIDEADGDVFSKMSHAAVEKSKYYSLDKIYNLWMDVL